MGTIEKSIVGLKRDEYVAKLDAWKRNEKRFQAGEDVFGDLRKFGWEEENAGAYAARKARAVYPEFPAMIAERFVGTLFQKWPTGDSMSLGGLETDDQGARAEMLRQNADGVGRDARTLFAFWYEAMERAMATKYRWIFAEGPAAAPQTLADERAGQRPYLVEYSPTQVPYWHFERGALQCCRVLLTERRPRVENGSIVQSPQTVHYVMTREGFGGWGETYAGGGWWMLSSEGELLTDENGQPRQGTWEATGGEIPMVMLPYERGARADSRTGITHLGRIATAYMDLFSAQMNDAWESGSGVTFLTGVNKDQWDTIVKAGKQNAKWVPVPGVEGGSPVGVQSVAEGTGSAVIDTALERLMRLAMQLIAREITTSPNASGRARELQYAEGASPRLANMAGNIEEAMTSAHRYLEQRWGYNAASGSQPTFSVSWPRRYDLRSLTEKVGQVFDLFRQADAVAPELFADMLMQAARAEGLLPGAGEAGDGANAPGANAPGANAPGANAPGANAPDPAAAARAEIVASLSARERANDELEGLFS